MMQQRNQLIRQLDVLARDVGIEAEAQSCLVLAAVVEWLISVGHGDVKLSAFQHMLGAKFRTDSVVSVGTENKTVD